MKYFMLYVACLATSMYFVDIDSANFLFSIVAPICIGLFIFLIITWLIVKGASSQHKTGSSDGVPFSGDGDCGGGDC